MNTVGKVFTTIGVIGTVAIAAAGTELATLCYTDTENPINLYTYLRFKSIENDIEDRGDRNFLAVKAFVNSHNRLCTLTAIQTRPMIGPLIDEFNFYKSWNNIPPQVKNDATLLTDWEAVKRYITIKEREIKEQKAKENMKLQAQTKNSR